MIKLERVRTIEAITAGLRGKKRKDKSVLLLKEFYAGNFNFNSEHWKKAKNQLKKESNGKCAYCEAPTNTVAHGDVEHFRPKSVYWWLAYCYENYSYSCQICNQVYKSDKFPIVGTKYDIKHLPEIEPADDQKEKLASFLFPDPLNEAEGLSHQDFNDFCEVEKSGLIDPYSRINPEVFFAWEADETLKEVKLIPRKNTTENQIIVKEAEECLGLNREELRKNRWKKYSDLLLPKLIIESNNVPIEAVELSKKRLKEIIGGDEPFTGMCRYFVRDIWNLNLD
jgi:uncharacterized protein (TIGR02646 family)